MKRTALVAAVAVGALAFLLGACSQPAAVRLTALTVVPNAGPPGTAVRVTGLALTPADAGSLSITVGDQRAPFRIAADGTLSVALPLFAGADGWPDPPTGPQALEVRRAGRTIGRADPGITVTALPRAAGSTRSAQADLARIADAYDALWSAAPAALPQELPLRHAVVAALHGLASGSDDSLSAVLDGSSPLLAGTGADVDLADALLASSGALAYLDAYASALQGAASQAQALRAQALPSLCDSGAQDLDLACEMQIYVVLDDYTQAFVKPTVSTYGNTVGLAAGELAIAGVDVPAAGIIGAILGVSDFVMEKIAPALYPSHLTRFDLEMAKTTIDVGQSTTSDIVVAAANNPPPITVSDVIQQALTVIGLKGFADEDFDKVLENAAKFTLGLYMQDVSSYEAGHPGTFPWVDAGVARMPAMTWGPLEITTPRLVKLFSADEDVVRSLPDQIEWTGAALGEATVRVTPRGPGSKAKVLHDNAFCLGCVYYGGAFGNDQPESHTTVVVGDVHLTASPAQGNAPLTTTLAWTGLTPQTTPYACTLDFGDGSSTTIDDCAHTTSATHTYGYTSALVGSAGAYTATLSVLGTEEVVTTSVRVDWTFTATPSGGTPPLDVLFAYAGFDPADAPLSCVFDPGDGGAPQTISPCGVAGTITHTYTASGTFSAGLAVEGGGATTLKSATVTSGATPMCLDPSAIAGWQGSVTFLYDGSASQSGESVSVHREANVQVLVNQPGDSGAGPYWNGSVVGGTANLQDVWTNPSYTETSQGSTLTTDPSFSYAQVEVTQDTAGCHVEISMTASVDPLTLTGDPTFSGTYHDIEVGEVVIDGPLTSTTELAGQAVLPIFPAQAPDGYLSLSSGGTAPITFESVLNSDSGGAMGTASVSWDLTAVPSSP